MIVRNMKLNVSSSNTAISPVITFYKKDSGILLNIEINLNNFKFKMSEIQRIDATVTNKDNEKNFVIKNLKLSDDNTIQMLIAHDSSIWKKLDEGTYAIQLHFFDAKLNRISIPSFDIVCKDTIY